MIATLTLLIHARGCIHWEFNSAPHTFSCGPLNCCSCDEPQSYQYWAAKFIGEHSVECDAIASMRSVTGYSSAWGSFQTHRRRRKVTKLGNIERQEFPSEKVDVLLTSGWMMWVGFPSQITCASRKLTGHSFLNYILSRGLTQVRGTCSFQLPSFFYKHFEVGRVVDLQPLLQLDPMCAHPVNDAVRPVSRQAWLTKHD